MKKSIIILTFTLGALTLKAQKIIGEEGKTASTKTKISSANFTELSIEIRTGGDDLRGGSQDNVSVTIRKKGGHEYHFPQINNGARWKNYQTHAVNLTLNKPTKIEDIESIIFTTSFSGGISGDNWNLDAVKLTTAGSAVILIKEKSGNPLHRFTAKSNTYHWTIR